MPSVCQRHQMVVEDIFHSNFRILQRKYSHSWIPHSKGDDDPVQFPAEIRLHRRGLSEAAQNSVCSTALVDLTAEKHYKNITVLSPTPFSSHRKYPHSKRGSRKETRPTPKDMYYYRVISAHSKDSQKMVESATPSARLHLVGGSISCSPALGDHPIRPTQFILAPLLTQLPTPMYNWGSAVGQKEGPANWFLTGSILRTQ